MTADHVRIGLPAVMAEHLKRAEPDLLRAPCLVVPSVVLSCCDSSRQAHHLGSS